MIAAARPRSAQAYSISVSGTLEGTDTRWRASYSWQPEDTVTEVAPFTAGPPPHLHMRLRQPVLAGRDEIVTSIRCSTWKTCWLRVTTPS